MYTLLIFRVHFPNSEYIFPFKLYNFALNCTEKIKPKISRNMTYTEKIMMTNIIGNFVADNIVLGMKVLAHHPEELSLEI